MDNSLEEIKSKIVRFQVQIESLEKQDNKLEQSIKDLKNDFEVRIDEFEEKVNKKLDTITTSMKCIEDIVTEARGARKIMVVLVGIAGSVGAFVTFIYSFIK